MKHQPIFDAIIRILAFIVAVTIVVFMVWLPFPTKRLDLVVNVVTELLGVLATVLILSLLLRKLEEQRRLPAKCLLYTKLIEMTDEFLSVTLPKPLRDMKVEVFKYKYADILASSILVPLDENDILLLPELIKRDIEAQSSYDFEPFVMLKNRVDAILDRSIDLLDPEPRSLLLQLSFISLDRIPTDLEQEVPMPIYGLREDLEASSSQGCWAAFLPFFNRVFGKQTAERHQAAASSQGLHISRGEVSRKESIQWIIGIVLTVAKLRLWLQYTLDRYFDVVNTPQSTN